MLVLKTVGPDFSPCSRDFAGYSGARNDVVAGHSAITGDGEADLRAEPAALERRKKFAC